MMGVPGGKQLGILDPEQGSEIKAERVKSALLFIPGMGKLEISSI